MTQTTLTIDLKWWTIRQNNSGGYWITDDDVAMYVFIQAHNVREAEAIYERVCGPTMDEYCECCGKRWYFSSYEEGTDEPMIYGEYYKSHGVMKWFSSEAEARLHYYQGSVASYKWRASVPPEIDNNGAPGTDGYFSFRD